MLYKTFCLSHRYKCVQLYLSLAGLAKKKMKACMLSKTLQWINTGYKKKQTFQHFKTLNPYINKKKSPNNEKTKIRQL